MSSAVIQLIVLGAIAVFLILRLRGVLGTREGFEKPTTPLPPKAEPRALPRKGFEVIEGGVDTDIADHTREGSTAAAALAAMKQAEPGFHVGEFLNGARSAYEMILMAFENGKLESIRPYLDAEVYDGFAEAVAAREAEGLRVEAQFVGLREIEIHDAVFHPETREGEITVRFVGELTSVVKNAEGRVVEGNPNEIRRQRDLWTFARRMGINDPNWQLVATGG
jgi:predicted lipid-binding transport protein (Tim44 family)